jgi:hypothetical protein
MERVSLRTAFHGEPDMLEDGMRAQDRGPDQVTIEIKSGKVLLHVPNTLPDDQVISKKVMDEFLQLILELEDGSELNVTLDSGNGMVDTRLILASERGQASEG